MADAKRDNNMIVTLLGVSNSDGITPVVLWADPVTHRLLVVASISSHNLLSASHADSVAGSPVLGDIIIGNSTPKWDKLAGNTTATKKFLIQTGNGTISAAPSWGIIIAADIPDISATYALTGHNHSGVYSVVGHDHAGVYEELANKSTNIITDAASTTKYPSVKLIKDYADGLVVGLLDYRGGYDVTGTNAYPAAGGSGTAGAVLKGDMWIISVAGTMGTAVVQIGDSVIANTDTPGQTDANWNVLNGNVAYVPENAANKKLDLSDNSDTFYPSQKAVKTAVDLKAPSTAPTFATSITTDYLTASEMIISDANKKIISAPVATYPSLAELAHVKGVTSAIQTQFTGKLATGLALLLDGGTMTGKIVKAGTTEVGKTYAPATGAQTVALDCIVNNIHVVSGHADGTAITFTVANATSSQPFIVSILQGAVVSTITAWFATVRWAGGSAPTLTATANKRDTFGFIRTGANTYDGFIIGQNC
jgi:hypothetical protein